MIDPVMRAYNAHDNLKREFVETLGYAGKREIPEALVQKLATFIDNHPDDLMTTFYARSLLDKFYRKRTKQRSTRLFDLLNSFLVKKSALAELLLQFPCWSKHPFCLEYHDISAVWSATDELGDGYAKANFIGRYSYLYTDDIAGKAYQSCLAMSEPYKTRALGGVFPRMDEQRRHEIVDYVCAQFISGSAEAAYRLKFMFPYMDEVSRAYVLSAHLETPSVPETFIGYLIIRNAMYFDHGDAIKLAARTRAFASAYLRNRCLLALATHLPKKEIEALYEQFMRDFHAQPANVELIHNLYQFGAVLKELVPSQLVSLALGKIALFDDSHNEVFEQQKYGAMLFVMPMLGEEHRESAFSIAETIRGGYRRTLKSRLVAHFAKNRNFCDVMYAPICY